MKSLKRRWKLISVLTVVTLVSFVWHLPASWVYQQTQIQQQLPPSLKITEVSGVWWQGQSQLHWQNKPIAKVRWQWQPLAVITGALALDLAFQVEQSQLTLQAKVTPDQLELSEVSGAMKLSMLAGIVQLALLEAAQGELIFKSLSASLPLSELSSPTLWPQSVSGQLALVDFSAMGMTLPWVEVTPEQDDNGITLNVNGRGQGWQLTGQSWVSSDHRFAHDLKLTAQSAETLPDWAGLMMRQTAPNLAELKARGRW